MSRAPIGQRAMKMAALSSLRVVAESFARARLPQWSEFAERAILTSHDSQERMDELGYMALILRGQAKLVTRDTDGHPTVEQFLGKGDLAASRVKPSWATESAPPLSISRWYGRQWAIPDMELHSLTRSTVLHVDAGLAASLAERYPSWSRVYSAFLWSYIDIMWVIVQDARVKTAEQRYRELMGRPSPPTGATQSEIASFLGITRQALNRVIAASPDVRPPSPSQDDLVDEVPFGLDDSIVRLAGPSSGDAPER